MFEGIGKGLAVGLLVTSGGCAGPEVDRVQLHHNQLTQIQFEQWMS